MIFGGTKLFFPPRIISSKLSVHFKGNRKLLIEISYPPFRCLCRSWRFVALLLIVVARNHIDDL